MIKYKNIITCSVKTYRCNVSDLANVFCRQFEIDLIYTKRE